MSDFKKRFDNRNDNRPQFTQPRELDVDDEHVNWSPTPQAFQNYQVRDLQLANTNVRMALGNRFPASVRELKDSLLHSVDVIEQVLTSGIADGSIVENKGKYSLVPRTR